MAGGGVGVGEDAYSVGAAADEEVAAGGFGGDAVGEDAAPDLSPAPSGFTVPPTIWKYIEFQPKRHGDERGWFSEVWNQATLANLGITIEWVQDNEAHSAAVGTLRGLHFQIEPHAQDKLVRVVAGRVLDVAVDIRRSSSTFGQHVAVELSADLGNQLLVPRGFAHGYCTMEPESVIAYKVSGFYSPECDRSLKWDDPDLGIDWPVDAGDAIVSGKDQRAPSFQDIGPSLFD